MTKSSKSTATIRRRKSKPTAEFLSRIRKYLPNKVESKNSKEQNEDEVFFHKEVLRSSVIEKIMSSDKTIFLGLLVIRLVNAMLIQTWFVPDEFWQSVEVAHKMVFDYGYLTWEWKAGIRSYAYPLIFASLYKILDIFGLDNRLLLIRGPRLVQGAIGSVGDLYLYFLSRRLAGRDVAQWSLLCQLLSWFTGYCCTRTLSNSMESVLVTAALFYFPWPGHAQPKGYTRRFVLLAASSVVVRPTAAVIWILLCSWHLQQSKGTALWAVLRLYITAGLTVLGVSTVIDHVWYGRWVLVHLNFLQFNVLSGGSGFYGRHAWHWYLSQGLPVVLGLHTVPFLLGAWRAGNKVLLLLLVWKVFVLSFLAHKEFRFLLPVLPLAMHYCGVYFHSATKPPPLIKKKKVSQDKPAVCKDISASTQADPEKPPPKTEALAGTAPCEGGAETTANDNAEDGEKGEGEGEDWRSAGDTKPEPADKGETETPEEAPQAGEGEGDVGGCKTTGTCGEGGALDTDTDPKGAESGRAGESGEAVAQRRRGRRVRLLVLLLAVSNLLPLLYFSLIHQRGTIDVMNFLHDAVARRGSGSNRTVDPDVLFLMPCHSTPYYSHLHANVTLRFLTCPPNLAHAANYTDEADIFYQDPNLWLRQQFLTNATGEGGGSGRPKLPTHVVYFNVLLSQVAEFLTLKGYQQCGRFFHTHLPEGRLGSHILVSCR